MAVIRSQYTKNLEERLAKKESFAQAHKGAVEQSRVRNRKNEQDLPGLIQTLINIFSGKQESKYGVRRSDETEKANLPPAITEIANKWNIRS